MRLHRILGLTLHLPRCRRSPPRRRPPTTSTSRRRSRSSGPTTMKDRHADRRTSSSTSASSPPSRRSSPPRGFTRNDAAPDVVRALPHRVRRAEGHLDLQLRPDVRRATATAGEAAGASTTTDVRVREILVGHPRDRHRRRQEEGRWRGAAWARRRSTRTPSRKSATRTSTRRSRRSSRTTRRRWRM